MNLINIFYLLTDFIREKPGGKISSIRIVLFLCLYITYDLLQFWKEIVFIEIEREADRDLPSVMNFGVVIVTVIIGVLLAKIVQEKLKKYDS